MGVELPLSKTLDLFNLVKTILSESDWPITQHTITSETDILVDWKQS